MKNAFLALIALAVIALGNASAEAYTNITTFGAPGTAPGQLHNVTQIALDPSGDVYVADSSRITKFAPDGAYIKSWEVGPNNVVEPYGIGVDPTGKFVYVGGYGSDSVAEYTTDGSFVRAWGSFGTGDGQFRGPGGIVVTSDRVYVTDGFNHRVQEFTRDGTFAGQFGTAGTADGDFDLPDGIAADAHGNLYVTDDNAENVQEFTSDGTFIRKWGTPGTGPGQFDGPYAISVDPVGNLWITDWNNHRVQQFAPDGTLLSAFGNAGSGDFGFGGAVGVVADCHGIYVSDNIANHVRLFGTDSIPACPQPAAAPPSQPPPPPPPPPVVLHVTLSAAHVQHVLLQRGIRVTLSANERTTFTVSAVAAGLRFKPVKAVLAAAGTKTVKLGLSKSGLRRLRAHRKPLRARVTVIASDGTTRHLTIKLAG